jgi:hypothetical protein
MPNRPVRPLKKVTPVGTRRNAGTFIERISPPSSVQVTVEPVWYLAVSSAFDRAVSSLSPDSMFSPKAVGWRQLKALSEPSRPGGGSRISSTKGLYLQYCCDISPFEARSLITSGNSAYNRLNTSTLLVKGVSPPSCGVKVCQAKKILLGKRGNRAHSLC